MKQYRDNGNKKIKQIFLYLYSFVEVVGTEATTLVKVKTKSCFVLFYLDALGVLWPANKCVFSQGLLWTWLCILTGNRDEITWTDAAWGLSENLIVKKVSWLNNFSCFYKNGRQAKWKTSKMETYQNGRQPKWKTTKMEDVQNFMF